MSYFGKNPEIGEVVGENAEQDNVMKYLKQIGAYSVI